jgi:hypothetical protein
MLYIKHSTIGKEPNAKLLYLMGATWHNKCMFDLEALEDNFSDLLNQQGIETYTFNYFGTGPHPKTEIIGDQHATNIAYAKQVISQYNIKYVMGYSYGANIVLSLLNDRDVNLSGVILLDPFTKIPITADEIDGGDKYVVTKENIIKSMNDHNAEIDSKILKSHLDALVVGDAIITATYPKTFRKIDKISKANLKGKILFTKNSTPTVRSMFPENLVTLCPLASHWVLLEDHRKGLAKDISEFILQ